MEITQNDNYWQQSQLTDGGCASKYLWFLDPQMIVLWGSDSVPSTLQAAPMIHSSVTITLLPT